MGLRIFGAVVALLLAVFAIFRYRKGQLRRGELVAALLVVLGLTIAALAPRTFDSFLTPLGFKPGQERARIIGLLVLLNLFTLALVFRGFSREDQLSDEIGDLVDYMALRRLEEEGVAPADGACVVVLPAFNEADNLPTVLSEMPTIVGDCYPTQRTVFLEKIDCRPIREVRHRKGRHFLQCAFKVYQCCKRGTCI